MIKNHHFKTLLEMVESMPIDIPGMRLIAQSENGFDNLFFDTAARNLLVCLKRENMICEIIQSFDAPASFDLEVL